VSQAPLIPSKPGGSLGSRLVVATIVIAAFTALAWADATGLGDGPQAAWLLPVAFVVAIGGGLEAVRLAALRGVPLASLVVPTATAVIAISPAVAVWTGVADSAQPWAVMGATTMACVAAVGALFATEVARYASGGMALVRLAGSLLAVIAIGLPLAFIVGLRLLEPHTPRPETMPWISLLPLASLIAVVKAGDIAAYAIGSLVGRHRMAPALSPGKTWEGAAASLTASVFVAWLVIDRWGAGASWQPLGSWPFFGLLVGAAGMAGDLSESLVKRELAAKDSGASLGGMGGFLDLIDSLLFAAPVAWVLWVAGR
jgi:phosphatidate cytidylyltransferase